MAIRADSYDPWNATVQSAAAGTSWRVDAKRSDSGGGDGLLSVGETDRASQFQYLVMNQASETPQQNAYDAPKGDDLGGNGSGASGAPADDGFFTFDNFVDTINPLQHIPLVSSIYREMTGDDLSSAARVAGGTLFFGPLGTLSALANIAVEDATGKDLGEHMMALFDDVDPNNSSVAASGKPSEERFGAAFATTLPEPSTATAATAAEQDVAFARQAAFDPIAQALGGTQQAIAANMGATAPTSNLQPSAASASPPASFGGAVPLSALPPDMLEALQNGGAVRPLSPQGFQFSEAPVAASPAPRPAQPANAAVGEPQATLPADQQADRLAERVILENQQERQDLMQAIEQRPAGSTASEGGWFSSAMIEALGRYENTQALTSRSNAPILNVQN